MGEGLSRTIACRVWVRNATARLPKILQRNTKIELILGEVAPLFQVSENWLGPLVKGYRFHMLPRFSSANPRFSWDGATPTR